jgi:hypothetical protein
MVAFKISVNGHVVSLGMKTQRSRCQQTEWPAAGPRDALEGLTSGQEGGRPPNLSNGVGET